MLFEVSIDIVIIGWDIKKLFHIKTNEMIKLFIKKVVNSLFCHIAITQYISFNVN